MNKLQKPAYQSPGLKTINLTPRSSVCQNASLLVILGELDESGEPINL